MHFHGINIRYLMVVYIFVKRAHNKRLLATEMAARTLKHCVRSSWRAEVSDYEDEGSLDRRYKAILAGWINRGAFQVHASSAVNVLSVPVALPQPSLSLSLSLSLLPHPRPLLLFISSRCIFCQLFHFFPPPTHSSCVH